MPMTMTNQIIGAPTPNPVAHINRARNERGPQIHRNHQTQRSSLVYVSRHLQPRETSRLARSSIESTAPLVTNPSTLQFKRRFCQAVANLPSAGAQLNFEPTHQPLACDEARIRVPSRPRVGLKVPNSTSTNSLTDLDATINQSTPPE